VSEESKSIEGDEARVPEALSAIEERREDHAQRIAELEAKLARPSNVGVRPLVSAVALAFSLYVLWGQRSDLQYSVSSTEPIDLGAEGGYRFDLAQSNRYVMIHGVPSARGWYWQERATTVVAVGINDTPIIMRRPTLTSEPWVPGTPGPRPDPRPFTAKGRLLARSDAPRYEQAFAQFETWSGTPARWILLQEEKPGADIGGRTFAVLLGLFAALNGWMLVRGLVRMVSR